MAPSSDRAEDLIRQPKHSDPPGLRAGREAPGKLPLEPLIARLDHASAAVREAACEALGKLGDARTVEPMIARLEDDASVVRRAACQALRKLGDGRAEGPLISRLCDSDSDVRQAAARALRSLGQGRVADAVMGALDGRLQALEELARLVAQGDLRAVDPLVARMSDPELNLRQAAGQALGRISEPLKALSGELLCGSCLTRFEEKKSSENTCWFACRVCGKAGKALVGVKQVVAVLDEGWGEELLRDAGVLRVNWLKRRAAFDFDRAEVVRASDYEVERLCVVAGNEGRFKTVPWVVAPRCVLSENTLRVLRSTFGQEGC